MSQYRLAVIFGAGWFVYFLSVWFILTDQFPGIHIYR